MLKIESGFARDVGIKFWEIVDGGGTKLTEFNHNRFPTILGDAPVYFMNLDVDPQFCENVQAAYDVDGFVSNASSPTGIGPAAEAALRLYVMAALLNALGKQGAARQNYLGLLRHKMETVATTAAAFGTPVTIALLQQLGIVGH